MKAFTFLARFVYFLFQKASYNSIISILAAEIIFFQDFFFRAIFTVTNVKKYVASNTHYKFFFIYYFSATARIYLKDYNQFFSKTSQHTILKEYKI